MAELRSNVNVTDPETGESKWYGPDYPENGDPPEGAVTNKVAFEVEAADLTPREILEGNADPTRAGGEVRKAGADETGDQSRQAPDEDPGRGRRGGTR